MAPDQQPAQALTVRLPHDLYEKLRRAAFEQHTSMNTLIIEALRKALPAWPRQAGSRPD